MFFLIMTVSAAVWAESGPGEGETEERTPEILFSAESGFYSQPLKVGLAADGADAIYYTLDGSAPAEGNAASVLYDEEAGIALDCGEEEKVYTLNAVADIGGTYTQVYTQTYILAAEIMERYEMSVLSVSGDPAVFYDSEDGLLASEARFERGREYERPVQMTLFDRQGEVLLSRNCGFRIYGGFSRKKNQPSFRLYARSEYDDEKKFNYYFFDDEYNSENVLIDRQKRIIVRNSGNDHGYAHLRNELAGRLARQAGFPDTQCASPVCVYVNGEYQGFYWLVNNFDEWYFKDKYGDYDGEMIIRDGEVYKLYELEKDSPAEALASKEYNALHEYVANADLRIEENWEMLNERIDVENFLQYVALQNYFCNADAFNNNVRVYRYYSPEGKYQPDTVFDGRYRYILFDLDQTLYYGYFSFDHTSPNRMITTERVEIREQFNIMFSNIMARQDAREEYARYYLSLLNYYFEPSRAIAVMEEMHYSRIEELYHQWVETDLLKDDIFVPVDADYSFFLSEIEYIRSFLEERPGYALQDLANAFGLVQEYQLYLENQSQASISVDYASFCDTQYEGVYFGEIPIAVTASPGCGYVFDYWLVNDMIVEKPELILTGDMITDGIITLECVCSPEPGEALMITALKSKGDDDYIELTNFGQKDANLGYYFLSDKGESKSGYFLPGLRVTPGESIKIYCKNCMDIEALGKPGVSFSLKAGETLGLYRINGELIQSVTVPDLGRDENVYRMDPHRGIFREELP